MLYVFHFVGSAQLERGRSCLRSVWTQPGHPQAGLELDSGGAVEGGLGDGTAKEAAGHGGRGSGGGGGQRTVLLGGGLVFGRGAVVKD